jgi:hypothetical protein
LKIDRVSAWVQIATGLALVLGLVLVLIELIQARTLATLQLTSDGFGEAYAYKRQLMGENPSPILVKGCLHPELLTEAEIAVNMAAIDYRYDTIMYLLQMTEISGDAFDWQPMAAYNLKVIFSTKLGRVEYDKFKDDPTRWDPKILTMARKIIEDGDYIPCEKRFAEWKSGLQDESL